MIRRPFSKPRDEAADAIQEFKIGSDKIVVRIYEVSAGRSAIEYKLNGVPFDREKHPSPIARGDGSQRVISPEIRDWLARIKADPAYQEAKRAQG